MGKDLAEAFPGARDVFAAVDEALGVSLSRIMWDGPAEELTLTHNAQPAILAHTLAAFAVVRSVLQPVIGAGHSLGEYSAYAAAGALRVADAARLVRRRGELMYDAGRSRPGTMAAVVGMSTAQVTAVCLEASGGDGVVVAANLNAPDQTVISGDPVAVERAGSLLREAGAKRVLSLNVSGAFHSPLMAPAEQGLLAELAAVTLADPAFPIVANATAEPVHDAKTARRYLGAQLTSPVRWVASMERAVADAGADVTFVEVGPGTVLSGLLRRIAGGVPAVALGTADQLTSFLEQHA
jgi:[acyl-carrier-protein] S-malonyltransferase